MKATTLIVALAPVLALALPAAAQEAGTTPDLPALSMEQETALRCGVAFAVVHGSQKSGDTAFADYPQMGERGREFFVRTTAQLMEATGADREAVGMLVVREAKSLTENPQVVHDVMPACLMLLDASGL